MLVKRLIEEHILAAHKSILLLGPRQTGKSTLFASMQADLTVNLAKENNFLRYSSDPSLFLNQIENNDSIKSVFVDEIQRIPTLLNDIQAIIDESQRNNRFIKFLLSSSSARKLKRGHANLLPGRIFTYQLSGFCAKELNYQINIEKALKYGFLPELCLEPEPTTCEKLLESYAATYLKEEIQAEALTRNINGFSRFLVNLAGKSGQILDFSKLATKAKVSRSSSVRFIEILEDTLIAERIYVFDKVEQADLIYHPKLYFFDVGVLNGLLNNFIISLDRKGILFEHLVYSQIKNSAIAHDIPVDIKFFRTRHGLEVDFIVTLKDKIWAIEVKSHDVDTQDLKGLQLFSKYYPNVYKSAIVAPQEKTRIQDGIFICDIVTLLQEMGL